MFRPARLSIAIASVLMLSGCMFFETRADRALRQQPNFRLGYEDGCATSNAQGANMRHGNTVRDDALYDADKAYRVGWANGHSACMRALPNSQDQSPLQDVHPGGGH
ncbi:MAG TPA: hypothetical protein VMF58_01560 [Rhizomicrobium sp.]|nr:hypothetical protein [Rhizomicrobium sp.]